MSKDEKEDKKELPGKSEPKPEKKSEKPEQVWIWCDPSLITIWLKERITEEQKFATTQDGKPVLKRVDVEPGKSIIIGKWNGRDMGNLTYPRVDNQPKGIAFKANLPASYMLTPSEQQTLKDQVNKQNKAIADKNKHLKFESQKTKIKYDMFKFVKL